MGDLRADHQRLTEPKVASGTTLIVCSEPGICPVYDDYTDHYLHRDR